MVGKHVVGGYVIPRLVVSLKKLIDCCTQIAAHNRLLLMSNLSVERALAEHAHI